MPPAAEGPVCASDETEEQIAGDREDFMEYATDEDLDPAEYNADWQARLREERQRQGQ
jgi:hypothetical protein